MKPTHNTYLTLLLLSAMTLHSLNTVCAQSHLGPFEKQLRSDNPLRGAIHQATQPMPSPVDFDKDGDIDLVLSDYYGGNGVTLLRNDGTTLAAAFNDASDGYYANPFYTMSFGLRSTPAFADLDGDGDNDMLLGLQSGTFEYYKNTSATILPYVLQNGAWNSSTKTGNPFYGIDLGDFTRPIFVDFDNDGDKDVIVGTSYLPNNQSVYYYENDGAGNFAQKSLSGVNPPLSETAPAVLDIDGDGLRDIVVGSADGSIHFFKCNGTNSFTEQTGSLNPFASFNQGAHSAPAASDFDGDGDLDLVIGASNADQDLFFFENKGNGIFTEKKGLSNPLGGINVDQLSMPYFIDLDNDGSSELILSGFSGIKYFKKNNSAYEEQSSNPFGNLTYTALLAPSLIDLDGDGDKDLVGGQDNNLGADASIEYFRNDNGTYVLQDFTTGPFKDISINRGRTEFADIDNDGDFDFFISDYDDYNYTSKIRFFKNTGTAQSPSFIEMTGTQNPLDQVNESDQLYPRLVDLDHDLDLDMVIGEGGTLVENLNGNKFMYYENTGSIASPQFTYRGELVERGDSPIEPAPFFIDFDDDGDLDIFMGGASGDVTYFKNTNPPAKVIFSSSSSTLSPGVQVVLDPQLTLSDADNDSISSVVVSIANFEVGKELLTFNQQSGISGAFDAATGIVSFTGKATIAVYQSLLRTIAYKYTGSSSIAVSKNIAALVRDADGTKFTTQKMLTISFNSAPVLQAYTATLNANGSTTIDLSQLVSDPDGTNDVDWSTLAISSQPTSGASATIDAAKILHLNYSATRFVGSETTSIRVCDKAGVCAQGNITTSVVNTSPVIQTVTLSPNKDFNLLSVLSDAEDNLDPSTIQIIQQPLSGANASIKVISSTEINLFIDYAGITFSGTDQLTIKACDKIGACTESIISLTVDVSTKVTVYNAVAPNSIGNNQFMRIANLPQSNKVTIFNRWGDQVYAVDNYDHDIPGKRFEGNNSNGKNLPTGTYFYKIEYDDATKGKQELTGYLSLIQ